MITVTTTKNHVYIRWLHEQAYYRESTRGNVAGGGKGWLSKVNFEKFHIYRDLIQAILMSGKQPKKLNLLIEF